MEDFTPICKMLGEACEAEPVVGDNVNQSAPRTSSAVHESEEPGSEFEIRTSRVTGVTKPGRCTNRTPVRLVRSSGPAGATRRMIGTSQACGRSMGQELEAMRKVSR